MKIAKIRIKDFQQFKDIELDFTHPETGEPLDKVCFIGSNGTGKSTLLGFILNFYNYIGELKPNSITPIMSPFKVNAEIEIKFKHENQYFYLIHLYKRGAYCFTENDLVGYSKNSNLDLFDENKLSDFITQANSSRYKTNTGTYIKISNRFTEDITKIQLKYNDIVIYAPSESAENKYIQINDVPATTLNESLKLITNFPISHIVSSEKIEDFWKILIANIKKRENERQEFENASDNIDKSKRQLIEEFDTIHPKIMDKLSEIWNKILEKANLELDTEGVRNPIQLTDNLYAYIRTKDTKERVDYNRLSTGIRNFIFKIGHIYSLYFNREIERGFLLVDEPENSLYPDFLFDLMEIYDEIVKDKNGKNNTQMFFATHNPIVAAQFEPYERIILAWDETGGVKAHKGIVPAGDDPNDILEYDFALKNLMGKKGQEKWAEYVDLKKKLIRAKETDDKLAIAEQINKIGNAYNFSE
jgi:predicted ATPase